MDKRTSISDIESYRDICRLAVADDEVFKTFKSHPDYRFVLEHASFEQGERAIAWINRTKPDILHGAGIFLLEYLKRNDSIGSPEVFEYPDVGVFSPSSLRYLRVLAWAAGKRRLNRVNKIVEIGGGYGGLAAILCQFYDECVTYANYDLIEPLLLFNSYLACFDIDAWPALYTPEYAKLTRHGPYDLFVSTYAVSEVTGELQEIYLTNVIAPAKHGYIAYNNISKEYGIDSMTADEFIRKLDQQGKNVSVVSEEEPNFPDNVIIEW